MLDMGSLKQAFADISQAMSDISTFRQEALPQMAETILEFNKMAMEGESAIKKMEEAETARPLIDISPA